jgi:hypothetical protein
VTISTLKKKKKKKKNFFCEQSTNFFATFFRAQQKLLMRPKGMLTNPQEHLSACVKKVDAKRFESLIGLNSEHSVSASLDKNSIQLLFNLDLCCSDICTIQITTVHPLLVKPHEASQVDQFCELSQLIVHNHFGYPCNCIINFSVVCKFPYNLWTKRMVSICH